MLDSWESYSKIHTLGKSDTAGIFDDPVVIEEKVDGSQFSFGVYDVGAETELKLRSRHDQFSSASPNQQFKLAVQTVEEIRPKLHSNWKYVCEFLQKPRHNTLKYDRVPDKHLVLLDVCTGKEEYLSRSEKEREADRIGLEVTPLLYEGVVKDTNQLMSMLQTVSFLGGVEIEGIVIKSYNRYDRNGKILMAKQVSERFKEVHVNREPKQRQSLEEKFVEKYKTEARWDKAYQHLCEQGIIRNCPEDIGKVIKEVIRDLMEEEGEEIYQMVWDYHRKNLTGALVKGLPDWYQQKLVDMHPPFSEDEEEKKEAHEDSSAHLHQNPDGTSKEWDKDIKAEF